MNCKLAWAKPAKLSIDNVISAIFFQNFSFIKCLGFVKTIGRSYIDFVTTSFVLAAFHVMLRLLWTVIVDLHGKRTMPMPRAIC